MIRVVISGGGTGGHIYPGIAIARALLQLRSDVRILFIGGKGQRESVIVPESGFDFVPIFVAGFPRSLSLMRWSKALLKVSMGFVKSLIVLREFKPHVVIGTGGYVCGPVLLGAVVLHIPIVIQEQNAMPGITSRILGRWADVVHVPFQAAAGFFPYKRARITGNPIRPEIASAHDSRGKLGLKTDRLTISFLGGSQGAKSINSAVLEALKLLTKFAPSLQIIHQTGELDFPTVREAYDKLPFLAIVQPYFYTIEDVYAATDLVVCRAGGMTLAEITARGLPAVLIPYPYAAGDHQTFNARVLEENGGAVMIRNDQLTGGRLAEVIISLIEDRKKLSDMAMRSGSSGKPDAAREIAESVISLAQALEKLEQRVLQAFGKSLSKGY